MMTSRRGFIAGSGSMLALAGCKCPFCSSKPKLAVQLYSIRTYIGGKVDKKTKKPLVPGVGLAKALKDVAAIGYKGVEFAGYYGNTAAQLKAMLDDAGLVACGTHVGNSEYGFDIKAMKFNADVLKKTCEFNLGYGNNNIICPGGGNMPPEVKNGWGAARDAGEPKVKLDQKQADWVKKLAELYDQAGLVAGEMGCRIGLHNHTWEHGLIMPDGSTYWDYFFSHTNANVCMEQDVGWTVCAGMDPCDQFLKYPGRSPTLHAKENGMGPKVKEFDAILGQPGKPGAKGVDWDALIPAASDAGVQWFVVECERHEDGLTAIKPSYEFLASKGL